MQIARENSARVARVSQRNLGLRVGILVLLGAGAAGLAGVALLLFRSVSATADNVYSVLQGLEAAANLTVQATALGLFVHQMAGILPGKIRELYQIPDQYEPVAGIALGYPGNPDQLPDKLRQRELAKRTKKPLAEFVFTGRWGQTSTIAKG